MAHSVGWADARDDERLYLNNVEVDKNAPDKTELASAIESLALPQEWIKSHSCWNHLQPERPNGNFQQPLGLLGELRSRADCLLCQKIHCLVKDRVIHIENDGYNENQIHLEIVGSQMLSLHVRAQGDLSGDILGYCHLCPVGNYPNGATFFDTKHVAINDLKEWIRDCHNNHPSCDMVSSSEDRVGSILVIDAIGGCLRKESLNAEFLALSYVWGGQIGLQLTKANFQDLHAPGAFDSRLRELPRTIRDAISLTKMLGYRYLWVDALCIVQDDEANKTRHIDRMASIYSYAKITIVAADGDHADYGLKGIGVHRSDSGPITLNFGPQQNFLVDVPNPMFEKGKIYFTRGWTFQEYHLSARLLVFVNGQVFFKCQEYERQEGFKNAVYGSGHLPVPALKDAFSFPDLWRYLDMVQEYNNRRLTYDSDVIAAFSGVITKINKCFVGGFLHGLPAFFFDIALLWQPSETLRRRTIHNSNLSPPSWSWTGWAGKLDLEICKYGLLSFPSGYSAPALYDVETLPILSWFHSNDPSSMEKAQIDNSHYHYYNLRVPNFTNKYQTDPNERDFLTRVIEGSSQISDPPESFKRYVQEWELSTGHYAGTPLNPELGLEGPWPTYKHHSLKGNYSYPLPVTNTHSKKSWSGEPRYLYFQAERADFELGPFLEPRNFQDAAAKCKSISIVDSRGSIKGALRFNSADTSNIALISCELIAISRGKVNLNGIHAVNALDEAHDLNCLRALFYVCGGTATNSRQPPLEDTSYQTFWSSIGIYEFYNVMWIERSKGVAYRKALGRVFKKSWECEPREKVDIILG